TYSMTTPPLRRYQKNTCNHRAQPGRRGRHGHAALPSLVTKPNGPLIGLSGSGLESAAMNTPENRPSAPRRGLKKSTHRRFLAKAAVAVAGLGLCGVLLLGLAIGLTWPNLPALHAMTDYRPSVPLRIYTADGVLIGEFGEEHRNVVRFEEIPLVMKQAILAAE